MSMAIKYGMNKRKRMYDGGTVPPNIDEDKAKDAAGSMRKAFRFAEGGEADCKACKSGTCAAHGGLVDRIMTKRMSEGGMVANDTLDNRAADKEAQYDDLVLRDDLEFSYTGANSGDELGDETLDDEERDLVARIMRSRAKKDRMPRPA